MFNLYFASSRKILPSCTFCRFGRYYGQKLENKYSEIEKKNILEVINKSDVSTLSRYDVTKKRSKSISQYINNNGPVSSLIDIELIEGFSEKHAEKLFDSILQGKINAEEPNALKQIKGQILNPTLSENMRQAAKSVLTVYITINSVSWTLIDKSNYEVLEWQYQSIHYPENKRYQLSDILEISWNIVTKLPTADIYVMKAEATSLRASGSDPNNPKVLGINLQKAQMVSMMVAFISARGNMDNVEKDEESSDTEKKFIQNVFFLRSSLPFRLYGTLIGNERVTSDQTVEMLLKEYNEISANNSHVYVPDRLQARFRDEKDLERDMMAQCMLFALTFMDLCIYRNKSKIDKLLSKKAD
ncbi:transcription elongation factor, mitochondrial isoform X2 [Zerene cesonia]|uniref:transcription elongation factor, mitochondrial isoform X2 n=1 Tax=Zerene cesonia TaxID=33412 RepID=UPI0018E56329|nr:transcription elongation factor, mitochondrial isoform X2 [Zerene cesonia]